jgi:hypothetical protein
MRKNLKHQATRIATLVKKVRWDSILPFTEKPSDEKILPSDNLSRKKTVDEHSASDLFSIFTADIIKEDVVFTR